MRIYYLLMLPLIIHLTLYEVNARSLKFIYYGTEVKPHGTLLISPDSLIEPTDAPGHAAFGLGLKTNLQTFRSIEEFVYEKKYTSKFPPGKSETGTGYVITDEFGMDFYLPDRNLVSFFSDLTQRLQARNADKVVIEAFKYYYSNWRNPNP
jgi:hypothetical protein